MSFEIGATVTVVQNTSGHRFRIGEQVVVVGLDSDGTVRCSNGANRFYLYKRDIQLTHFEPITSAVCCGREMIKIGEAKEWEVVPLFECPVCMDIMLSNGEKLVNKVTPPVYNYPVGEEEGTNDDEVLVAATNWLDELVLPIATDTQPAQSSATFRLGGTYVSSTRPRS